jgi:hypothetical protein
MEVGKSIVEVIEEKRLRWFGHVKRMPGNRTEQNRNHGLTEEDTRSRDRWRNSVLGEGKPL